MAMAVDWMPRCGCPTWTEFQAYSDAAQLEEERARREQLEATLEQRVQAQAQMQAQVQDMFSYFQAQFEAIGHPLPPHPTWAPRPPISSPPMPGSAGSNAGAGAAPVQDVDLSAAVRNLFPSAPPPFDP
ncbi:hypothetical protein EJB05_01458, partial [Eragrostis curvula]